MNGGELIGKRIRLLAMPDDPNPLPIGSTGTVTGTNPVIAFGGGFENFMQIFVEWDNGRTIILSVPPDRFEVLP